MMQNRSSIRIHKELLLALESARTRLAIATAAEAKSTPLDQWRYYLDAADRMRCFIRKLRREDAEAAPKTRDWVHALETLRRLPVHDKAQRLCRTLEDIVKRLE